MGYLLFAFDIGAPTERVRKYSNGYIISKIDAEEVVLEILKFTINI